MHTLGGTRLKDNKNPGEENGEGIVLNLDLGSLRFYLRLDVYKIDTPFLILFLVLL